jgi:hypothetical protein
MGDTDFESAWSDGATFSTDEAIAYTQRGRGDRKRPTTGWASLTPAELNVARLVSEGLPKGYRSSPPAARRTNPKWARGWHGPVAVCACALNGRPPKPSGGQSSPSFVSPATAKPANASPPRCGEYGGFTALVDVLQRQGAPGNGSTPPAHDGRTTATPDRSANISHLL